MAQVVYLPIVQPLFHSMIIDLLKPQAANSRRLDFACQLITNGFAKSRSPWSAGAASAHRAAVCTAQGLRY
jgi:hypothetical protein